nr:ARS-binding factor-1 [Kluyveromyces lactis]
MSLYEYKHPIINKDLAAPDPVSAQKRSFPTLEAWYDVINDYEFQSRCPIILKNSHKNKHFTFACHLKSCPFKILLSYQGANNSGSSEDGSPHGLSGDGGSSSSGSNHHNGHTNLAEDGRAEDEDDDEDDDAAVAAVADSQETIKGPFVVTKIEPYHNHPLESNLSLQRFVLSKIPKILQVDLKFDAILESLCNDDDNTVAKFRVAQYVEESGILDIIKQRYGLTEAEMDKKMLSNIARRVTTYKARFVLKRKKDGVYAMPTAHQLTGGDHHQVQHHHHPSIPAHHQHQLPEVNNATFSIITNSNSNNYNTRNNTNHMLIVDIMYIRTELVRSVIMMIPLYIIWMTLTYVSQLLQLPLQRLCSLEKTTIPRILKRTLEQVQDDESLDVGVPDSKRQLHRRERDRVAEALKMATRDILSNQSVDSDVNVDVDLVTGHKQLSPHDDMAEQLRLLSSHLKEVEAEENVSDNNLKKDDIPDENIQPELRGQ